MSALPPIRILSDLHLAHPASMIQEVAQLAPLFEGARTVVFNGDTVELRLARVKSRAEACREELAALCARGGAEPCFINGNHDPNISRRDHLDLMSGRVFVTHGHALFPSIAPWGREARSLGAHYRQALEEMSEEGEVQLEERLEAARRACLRMASGEVIPRTALRWWGGVLAELGHPLRVFAVFRAWATAPGRAAAFAALHRPEAECFIMGHTHLPGFWRCQGKLVLNTGAFFPGLGRRVIDIAEGELSMRKVDFNDGCFRAGAELLRVPIGEAKLDLDRVLPRNPR